MTKLQALEKEAASLPEEDRAALVAVLLNTFDAPPYDVDDNEVVRRDEEMETGGEGGVSHEEFVRAVRPPQPE
jgi:hypothetical protein